MFGFQAENGTSFRGKEKGRSVLSKISLDLRSELGQCSSEFGTGSIPNNQRTQAFEMCGRAVFLKKRKWEE